MSTLSWVWGVCLCLMSFSRWFPDCPSLQLVSAICKDLSMLSATPSPDSATVSRECILGSVTGAYPGTGAFQVANPASAMVMPMTVTQWRENAWAARTTPRVITVKGKWLGPLESKENEIIFGWANSILGKSWNESPPDSRCLIHFWPPQYYLGTHSFIQYIFNFYLLCARSCSGAGNVA